MGRGDKRSRKGKIAVGSYGNARPRKKQNATPVSAATVAKAPVKKKK